MKLVRAHLVMVAVSLAGCGSTAVCRSDGDCPSGQTCRNGACVVADDSTEAGPRTEDGAGGSGPLATVTDAWGDHWDTEARPASSHFEASATCEALGGRLPLLGELSRVRR